MLSHDSLFAPTLASCSFLSFFTPEKAPTVSSEFINSRDGSFLPLIAEQNLYSLLLYIGLFLCSVPPSERGLAILHVSKSPVLAALLTFHHSRRVLSIIHLSSHKIKLRIKAVCAPHSICIVIRMH